MKRLETILLGLSFCALPLACSSTDGGKRGNDTDIEADAGQDTGRDSGTTDVVVIDAPASCSESGERWSSGTTAFVDRTTEAGFEELGAVGVRMSGADYDSDGDFDLFIRRTGSEPNSFAEDGTRTAWLLRNDGGTFVDVTRESGIMASRFTGDEEVGRPADVAIWGDVDNDGNVDVYTGFSDDGTAYESSEIMLNNGDGTFRFGPSTPFQYSREPNTVGGAVFTDVDRDGRLDLWLTRGILDGATVQDELYLQTGDVDFERATDDVGLTTQGWTDLAAINQALGHTNSWAAHACDLNDDGTPDLLSASYGRAPNHLWLSGDDGYTNASVDSGYAFDHRQDWTDNESARCFCQLNPEADDCSGVPAPELIECDSPDDVFRWSHDSDREPFRLGGNSGTTLCGDLDNDGDIDLVTSEIVHWDVGENSDPSELLVNDGSGVFERPGNEATGLTRQRELVAWNDGDITAGLLDFDNDGHLDIYRGSSDYPGTRGLLYHNDGDGTFTRVPLADGIDFTSSHGVVVADFDRDGDLDIVAGHSRFRCGSGDHCYDSGHARYFENVIGDQSNWLQLDLVGAEGTNRSAIGARVRVTTPDGTQTREVYGGHGHYGLQDDTVVHVGLGEHCEAEVEIRWPDDELTTETYRVPAGNRFRITQGGEWELVD